MPPCGPATASARTAPPSAPASCSRTTRAPRRRAFEGLDANAATLTKRESQLVELAREGLSNAEIADRLVVSVRTVESHLYRAMHKLGVSDRRAL